MNKSIFHCKKLEMHFLQLVTLEVVSLFFTFLKFNYMRKNHMLTDEDLGVVRAMERYGGSFVYHLAQAFLHADSFNIEKLKKAFPEYWKEYTEWAKNL